MSLDRILLSTWKIGQQYPRPAPVDTDFFLALSFSDLAAMSTQNSWKKEQELRLDNQCHEQGLAEADNYPLTRRKW